MWESATPDRSPGDEPGDDVLLTGTRAPAGAEAGSPPRNGSAPRPAAPSALEPPPSPLVQRSAARVFSALANAGAPPSGGARTIAGGADPPDGGWSAEAVAARQRAQQRWGEGTGSVPPSPSPPAAPAPPAAPQAPVAPVPVEAVPVPRPEAGSAPPAAATSAAPWLPAPAPARTVAVTSFGPPGKRRSPAAVVVLSILTLGFYALWWHHRVNREMAEFDPRMTVDAERSTWAVAIPLLVGWMVAAGAAARYLLALTGTPTADLPIGAGQSLVLVLSPLVVPYLELLLPFSAVALVMTNERARAVEDRVQVPTDRQLRPVSALCWLLVPLAGGLVGMARLQRHLNAVWRRVTG